MYFECAQRIIVMVVCVLFCVRVLNWTRHAKLCRCKLPRFGMKTIHVRALTAKSVWSAMGSRKWFISAHTHTDQHMGAQLMHNSHTQWTLRCPPPPPFRFHHESRTHQTDQYHVNNNYNHTFLISFFVSFVIFLQIVHFDHRFYISNAFYVWFWYLFRSFQKSNRIEKVYEKLKFLWNMLKKKVISISM